MYNEFSYYYDALMKDMDYEKWSNYIIEVLRRNDVKYRDVCEMACGTGNMAVNLARKGFSVTAFDLSADMLSVASEKAVSSRVNVNFLRQDMCDIKIKDNFGIILCLCDSINYITDIEGLSSAFKWVYNHLKSCGIFIFDINSAYKLKNIIGSNTFTYNTDDLCYIWDNYIGGDNIVEFYLTFFAKAGELYKRFDEVHAERIYETDEIIDLLKKAGFKNICPSADFTFGEAGPQTERINFAVTR